MLERSIVIKTTGAIGDAIMVSALQKQLNDLGCVTGIISKGFTLPLWKGLESVVMYNLEDQVEDFVDLSGYLRHFPYSSLLPGEMTEEDRYGHLCEWMAYEFLEKTREKLDVSRDDVRIVLTPEEIEFGRDVIYEKSNGKPVVILSPYSTAKNKNLIMEKLKRLVKILSEFSTVCQLEPFEDDQHVENTVPVGDRNLRKSSAILLASQAYLGVDSGPSHMINGAIQGNQERLIDGVSGDPSRVIMVVGSSRPYSVSYEGNQTVFNDGGCMVAPCGAHGYWPLEKYEEFFEKQFFGTDGDKSGCVFKNYSKAEVPSCMDFSVDEVVERVRKVIR